MNKELLAALKAKYGVENIDDLVAIGDTVKSHEDGTFSGYLVRFGSPKSVDLEGDFFHKLTNYGFDETRTVPLFYQHGFDGTIKRSQIGKAELKFDDVGLWLEGQLQMRDDFVQSLGERAQKFMDGIKSLINQGKLALSSGAVSHIADGKMVGNAWQWDQWVVGEASLTPTPAEPQNMVKTFFKSTGDLEKAPSLESLIEVKLDGSILASANAIGTITNAGAILENSSTTEGATTFTFDQPITKFTIEKEPKESTKTQTSNTMPEDPKKEGANEMLELLKSVDSKVDKQSERLDTLEAAKTLAAKGANGAANPPVKLNTPAIFANGMGHMKYDHLSVGELAFMVDFMHNSSRSNIKQGGIFAEEASEDAHKAIALRLLGDSQAAKSVHAKQALVKYMVAKGMKADEIHQSTLSGFGDEWIGVAYSSDLWEEVRTSTVALPLLPQFEFPAGVESVVIPLDGAEPTWYNVAQSADLTSDPGGIPTNTVPSSQLATSNKTATLGKLGARTLYTGEIREDAVLPWVSELFKQMSRSGARYLDAAIIDGDTDLTATTNINDIAGTPAATDWFTVFNGFRKSPLITTTANSRDGGTLTTSDFLETAKLLGTNGLVGANKQQIAFLIDHSTNYKALELSDIKSKDVFTAATIEAGNLTGLWGYKIFMAENMCQNGSGLSNASGLVDIDTASNNTKGSILCIRKDKWRFGWRRRMTTETTRIAAADATEIVSLMRVSLTQRDTEAAAISYNITV